jgi:hypothetical protein
MAGTASRRHSLTSHDPPTLAEDLLLLLFQPRSGTIAGENTLFYVLAGAVLADLALRGEVRVGQPSGWSRGRLETVGDRPPEDDLLRSAWEYVDEKPRGVQTVLAAVGPPLRGPLLERLVDRGDIGRTERKVLFFRTHPLSEGRTGRRAALLGDLRATLVDGAEPTARVAALAALLSGSGSLHQLQPEIPWTSEVIARAQELESGSWGAGAAAEAVARTMAAAVVNSVIVATITVPRT